MSQNNSVNAPQNETAPKAEGQSSGGASTGSTSGGGHAALLRGMDYDSQVAALTPRGGPVQRRGGGAGGADVHAAAAHGISGGGGALPHGDAIQRSFGGYDISQVQAHTDSAAAAGSASMGADAYATGSHVAFKGAPDLHTAAHEAAHVVQQDAGVSLSGGVGQVGDSYEKNADAVADAVVQGKSAEPLLGEMAGAPSAGGGGVQQKVVQRKNEDTKPKDDKTPTNEPPNDDAGAKEAALAEKRDGIRKSMEAIVDPVVAELEARLGRVSSFGVDSVSVSDSWNTLCESEEWQNLTAVAGGEGDEKQVTAATDFLALAPDAMKDVNTSITAAINTHIQGLEQSVLDNTDARCKVQQEAAITTWYKTVYGTRLEDANERETDLSNAVVGFSFEVRSDPLGDGEEATKKVKKAQEVASAALDLARSGLDDGHKAVAAIVAKLKAIIQGVQSSQQPAIEDSTVPYLALFKTKRFGHPDQAEVQTRIAPFLADVTGIPLSGVDFKEVFATASEVTLAASDGLKLDNVEAKRWSTGKVASAESDLGYTAAMKKVEAPGWFAAFSKDQRDKFDSAWTAITNVYSEAKDSIRLGEANDGVSASLTIHQAEDTFKSEQATLTMLHEDALVAVGELEKGLSGLSAAVIESKGKAVNAVPASVSALFETTRFGDESLAEAARIDHVLATLAPNIRLKDPQQLRNLYDAVATLQIHFGTAKAIDGGEVEVLGELGKEVRDGYEARLAKAKALQWLIKNSDVGADFEKVATSIFENLVRTKPAIASGVEFRHDGRADVEAFQALAAVFEAEKADVDALPNSVSLAEVTAALKTHVASLGIGKDFKRNDNVPAKIESNLKTLLDFDTIAGLVEMLQLKPSAESKLPLEAVLDRLTDIMAATPEIRALVIDNYMGSKLDQETAEAAGKVHDGMNKVAELVKDLAAAKGEAKVDVVRAFVTRFGGAEGGTVLKEARTDSGVINHTKDLDPEPLALVNRMLLSGKPIEFQQNGGGKYVDLTPEKAKDPQTAAITTITDDVAVPESPDASPIKADDTAPTPEAKGKPLDKSLPIEQQLELGALELVPVILKPKTEAASSKKKRDATKVKYLDLVDSLHALNAALAAEKSSYINALKVYSAKKRDGAAAQKNAVASEATVLEEPVFDEALAKVQSAYQKKTSANLGIFELIQHIGAVEPHKTLITFTLEPEASLAREGKTPDAKVDDAGANATPKTIVDAQGATGKRVDLNGDQGGAILDDKEAAELQELHNEPGQFGVLGLKSPIFGKLYFDLDGIKALVGTPPSQKKVTYCLDRWEEDVGESYFKSDIWTEIGPKQGEVRKALGFTETDAPAKEVEPSVASTSVLAPDSGDKSPKAQTAADAAMTIAIGALKVELFRVATATSDKTGAIGDAITAAYARAVEAMGVLSANKDMPLEPAVAPNGRRPTTASMILLNVFASGQGQDLMVYLENLFFKQKTWFSRLGDAFYATTAKAEADHQGRLQLVAALKLIGFSIKVVESAAPAAGEQDPDKLDAIKGDISTGDTIEKIVGDKKFVVEGMKVRAQFDDKLALRLAENIHAMLNSDPATLAQFEPKKPNDPKEPKPVDKTIAIEILAGDFQTLIGQLAPNVGRVKHMLFCIQGLMTDERDATDSAFRARFGRTLMAEFKKGKVADTMKDNMAEDRDDPYVLLKNNLRGTAILKKDRAALVTAITKMTSEQREAVKADTKLLKEIYALDSSWKEPIDALLSGTAAETIDTLVPLLAEHKNVFKDDVDGAKTDVGNFVALVKTTVAAKYADALDDEKPNHVKDKAAFEVEFRSRIIDIVATDGWEKIAEFLEPYELRLLKAVALGGGTESKSQGLLNEMRDSTFWGGSSPEKMKATINGLKDAELAVVRDDVAVRVAIQKGLSAEDAATCMALLEGQKDVEFGTKKTLVGTEYTDSKALLASVRALKFAQWTALRDDIGAVLDLMGKVSDAEALELRGILKLDKEGSGFIKQPGYEKSKEPAVTETKLQKDDVVVTPLLKDVPAQTDTDAKTPASGTTAKEPKTAGALQDKKAVGKFLASQSHGKLLAACSAAAKKQRADLFLTELASSFGAIYGHLRDVEFSGYAADSAETEAKNAIIGECMDSVGDVSVAASKIFGQLWGEYEPVVTAAIIGSSDPAPWIVKYHSRGSYKPEDSEESKPGPNVGFLKGYGSSHEGIAAAITAASADTFIHEFTNLKLIGADIPARWQGYYEAKTTHEKAVKDAADGGTKDKIDAAKTAQSVFVTDMKTTRTSLVKVPLDKHASLKSALGALGLTKEKEDAINTAFRAKVVAVLGSETLADAQGKADTLAALGRMFGLSAESAGLLWDARTFQAYMDVLYSIASAIESGGKTAAIFKGDEKDGALAQAASVHKALEESTEGVDKEKAAQIGDGASNVAAGEKDIEARAAIVKSVAFTGGKLAIAASVGALGGPFALGKLLSAVGSVAVTAIRTWTEGGDINTFAQYVLTDALSMVGGEFGVFVLSELSAAMALPTAAEVVKWIGVSQPHLAAAFEAGIQEVTKKIAAQPSIAMGGTDPVALRIATEKGGFEWAMQTLSNLRGQAKDLFTTEGAVTLAGDLFVAMREPVLKKIRESVEEGILKGVGLADPKSEISAEEKKLDADKDGTIEEAELKELLNHNDLDKLGVLCSKVPEVLLEIPAVALLMDIREGNYTDTLKNLKKLGQASVKRAVEVLEFVTTKSIQALVEQDRGVILEALSKGTTGVSRDLQALWDGFVKDLKSGQIILTWVIEKGKSVAEAAGEVFAQWRLAESINGLTGEAGNEGLLDLLYSTNDADKAVALGFIQLRQSSAVLQTTLGKYEAKIQELVGTAVLKKGKLFDEIMKSCDGNSGLSSLPGFDLMVTNLAEKAGSGKSNPEYKAAIRKAVAQKLVKSGDGGLALFEDVAKSGLLREILDRGMGSLGTSAGGEKARNNLKTKVASTADDVQAPFEKAILDQMIAELQSFVSIQLDTALDTKMKSAEEAGREAGRKELQNLAKVKPAPVVKS